MPDWFSRPIQSPYIYLILGVFLFSLGVVGTYTGKTSDRFSWVYRAEEPGAFWLLVAMYYLGGLLFIGIFFARAIR
jgi:hypothetical protein